MARVWATLETGEILPKDLAANWALERAPDVAGPAVERARGVYLGTAGDAWDDLAQDLRPAADALLAAIREAAEERALTGSGPEQPGARRIAPGW
jgi:hypothetical protein